MRTVQVVPPSFPATEPNEALAVLPDKVWQVLCGDAAHWRAGVYSPAATSPAELSELERHSCPELFLLMEGSLTLVLAADAGSEVERVLQPGCPVLVTAPHGGYCPLGPHTGRAFVIERDRFSTEYQPRP